MRVGGGVRIARSALALASEVGRTVVDRVLPGGNAVPDRGDAISPRWLEQAMGLSTGTIRSVTVAEEHHGTASRARLILTAEAAAEVPARLFVKLAPRTLGGRLFMNTMGLGEREVRFYRDVASELPVRVPRCFAAQVDRRRGRNAIVLEDLCGRALFRDITQSCTVDDARAVVNALADLHGTFWNSPRFSGDLAPFLTRLDQPGTVLAAALVNRVIKRPTGMVAELVPASVQRSSTVLVEDGEGIGAFWSLEPMTFTHNDTHLGNLFFEDGMPGFLDWQNAGIGPGIRDVAYFVLPSLEPPIAREVERELVRSYVDRLAHHGVDLTEEHAWLRYRAAASQFFIGAVVTGAFGGRLQREDIARTGIERAVAAVQDLDSFDLLREVAASNHV